MTCRLCLSTTGRHRVPDIMVAERPYTKGQVVTDVPAIVIEINLPTTASTK
jgi:Uma2 family endonuclease